MTCRNRNQKIFSRKSKVVLLLESSNVSLCYQITSEKQNLPIPPSNERDMCKKLKTVSAKVTKKGNRNLSKNDYNQIQIPQYCINAKFSFNFQLHLITLTDQTTVFLTWYKTLKVRCVLLRKIIAAITASETHRYRLVKIPFL